MAHAKDVIDKLKLQPLMEEGGYFRETYRSDYGRGPGSQMGLESDEDRDLNTAIYYLLTEQSFSALHRITSDEIFHFYSGDPAEMIMIHQDGSFEKILMGSDIFAGLQPQVVVPRGSWQALKLIDGGKWALFGTTVAPGFDFKDFEVGERMALIDDFPMYKKEIIEFTRSPEERVHEFK